MRALAAISLLLAGFAAPALAQAVPAEADHALWCGHAFDIASTDFRSQGDAARADQMQAWGATLLQRARDILAANNFTEAQIEELDPVARGIAQAQIAAGAEGAKYSYESCTALVAG